MFLLIFQLIFATPFKGKAGVPVELGLKACVLSCRVILVYTLKTTRFLPDFFAS